VINLCYISSEKYHYFIPSEKSRCRGWIVNWRKYSPRLLYRSTLFCFFFNWKRKKKMGEKNFTKKGEGLKWGILSSSTCASRHKSVTVMFYSVKLNSACSAHLHKSLRTIFTSQGLWSALSKADRNPWLAKMLWNIHLSFLNGKILQIIYSITGALYNKILYEIVIFLWW
jgi:hypothetical protein